MSAPTDFALDTGVSAARADRFGHPWLKETWYCLSTVVVTLLGSLIPLLSNPRFYFYDDTQSGAFGIWFEVGEKLRAGEWPLFSDAGWGAGNYAAEGQWGLWNPLIMLIGLLASTTASAVAFSTVVKILFLCILSAGTFLLAREYGGDRPWSLVAGIAVPLTGFTVYMDSASWVTGLMVFALLPLVWLGLRRLASGKSPALGLLAGYLLITIGYVHGTLMLVIVTLGLLGEAWRRRSGPESLRLLCAGAILGLVALAVYLPGMLTAPVTARTSGILNTGFLAPDLTGFASSWIGSTLPQVAGWWGTYSPVPMLYIAWFLPLVFLIDLGKARTELGSLLGVVFFGLTATALVLAPSDLGPLRFPVRLTPYLSLSLLVLFAVFLSKCRVESISRVRVSLSIAAVGAGAYIAWGQNPTTIVHARFAALSAVGILGVIWVTYSGRIGIFRSNRTLWTAGILILVTLGTAIGQHHYYKSAPLPDYGLPDDIAAYSVPLEKAKGVAFIAGNPAALGMPVWDETLLANSWYLNRTRVQNLYTPIMFARYAEDLCLDAHGWTCSGAAGKLFTRDATTGKLLVDLLSIDTVQVIRNPAEMDPAQLRSLPTPAGWHVAEVTDSTLLWVRDEPLLNTGDVVWQTPGLELSTESVSSDRVVLKVDAVPENGGSVVLSRLNWPGYSIRGGELEDPLRGYLINFKLDPTAEGQEIVVEFKPPAWTFVITSIAAALVLILGWLLWDITRQWGRRRRQIV